MSEYTLSAKKKIELLCVYESFFMTIYRRQPPEHSYRDTEKRSTTTAFVISMSVKIYFENMFCIKFYVCLFRKLKHEIKLLILFSYNIVFFTGKYIYFLIK